jgi:DNA-binding NarL/FixJ family response regulator
MSSLQSILIAHANNLLCDALGEVLKAKGYVVQALTTDGTEAIRLINNHQPSVVILSNELNGVSGIQVATELISNQFSGKFIMLSKDQTEARVVTEKIAPAGHLHRWVSLNEFVYCLHVVLGDETYCTAIIERFLSADAVQTEGIYYDSSVLKELTPREIDILEALSHSYTTPKIAELFSISTATVNNHRASIMEKLNIKGRNKLLSAALSLRPYLKQVA